MQRAPASWPIDPDDPRAPPQEIWDQMTPEERRRVLDALPSEFEPSEASPPEGDFHFNPKVSARETLGGYFQRIGRRVYLACELPIYYPGQPMFAPDLIAVVDAEVKERATWTVSAEGKGIDLALEILWSGKSKKDLEDNVTRYAALGIPEYFVFDRRRLRIRGYRLAGGRRYQRIVPQEGRLACGVLGLELGIEGERLRFYHGLAALPETGELLARLGSMVGDLERRIDEAERHAEAAERQAQEAARQAQEAERRANEERLRADQAEAKLAEALAEIERLKRERG
ncbi:MAG: Uma2 family endonuclease [Minicystis sp.]